jgi:hypothetical protein
MIMCGKSPPVRISDLPRSRGSIPALLATPFPSARALMKDSPFAGSSDDLISRDDEGLFAFINTLRASVRAKVAAEQERGLSLSEIVVEVREMVRLGKGDARHPHPFPSHTLRAISRQAVAWCVEAYQPVVINAGADLPPPPNQLDRGSFPPVHTPVDAATGRFPASSPTYRGIP